MPVLTDSSSSSSSSSFDPFGAESSAWEDLGDGNMNVKGPCGTGMHVGGLGIRVFGTGALVFCFVVLILRRNTRIWMASTSKSTAAMVAGEEDGYEYHQSEKKNHEYGYLEPQSEPLLPSPSPSQQPTLFETNLTNVRNLQSIPSPPSTTSSTYPGPPPSDSSSGQEISSSTATEALKIDIPRRRSYTKTVVSGGAEIVEVEVNGEIVVSPEGWRRHTRVFGGGVCKACEESERRLSA